MGGLTRVPRSLILSGSGGGQAYAERTSSTAALGAAAADIPSLSISPVPDSSQLLVVMHLPRVDKDATASYLNPQITDSGLTIIYAQLIHSVIASGFAALTLWSLQTGLTPGTAFPVKGRMATGGGTATVFGNTATRPFIAALRA